MTDTNFTINPNNPSLVPIKLSGKLSPKSEAGTNASTKADFEPYLRIAVDKMHIEFASAQAARHGLNEIARSIRYVDATMLKIKDGIEKMKAKLTSHVKHFPPFPPGSEEREKLLRSFKAFRIQIDRLTIPPDNHTAAKIMAAPEQFDETREKQFAVEDGGIRITIHRHPVHTGTTGLNIPELPSPASDDMLMATIENLDTAQSILDRNRGGLSKDVETIMNRAYGYI